jgi:sterol desaturase/sphingolipid hydroxylase (fatty acid hydroxylase superfamily)
VGEQSDVNTQPAASGFAGQWHHRPQVPIKVSPFFSWPPDPRRMVTWVADRWFAVAENSILVLISLTCWMWFQPSMEEAKTLSIGWIAEIYVRNLILLFGVAGGLHLYFFVWKRQRMELKFDKRDLAKESRAFTFKNQVHDNMFWSLGSGVLFWSAYEALMFWAMANGYAPMLHWSGNPVWFVLLSTLPKLVSYCRITLPITSSAVLSVPK